MNSNIQIYNSSNVQALLDLVLDEENDAVRSYLIPFLEHPSEHFVANTHTELHLLFIDGTLIPMTMGSHKNDSYVVSLISHYIHYSKDELHLITNPIGRILARGLLAMIERVFTWSDVNRTIFVNNWMFSTNLYPDLNADEIQRITAFLRARYPNHYILFRSIQDGHYASIRDALEQNGYSPIPSRQVFLLKDEDKWNANERRHMAKDHRQIEKFNYRIVEYPEPTTELAKQIKWLYDDLYLEKYSTFNPAFTEQFYLHAMNAKLFRYVLVYDKEEVIGVIGYWHRKGIMTTPILGYATARGRETKAYQILSNLLVLEARKQGYLLNQSSGAAEFKLNRGCYKVIEYSYVYDGHIPALRRWPFAIVRYILTKLGVYLFNKYEFK